MAASEFIQLLKPLHLPGRLSLFFKSKIKIEIAIHTRGRCDNILVFTYEAPRSCKVCGHLFTMAFGAVVDDLTG